MVSPYLDYLDALNTHFEQYPYLLGWRPSIGDFGLIAPMYAHLGRDPYPARLMQQRAVSVYRWVERMNRYDQDEPEFFNAGTDFVNDDEVPESLMAVLRVLAEDFVPETLAAAEAINGWMAEKNRKGCAGAGRLAKAPGTASFVLRGETIEALYSRIVLPCNVCRMTTRVCLNREDWRRCGACRIGYGRHP